MILTSQKPKWVQWAKQLGLGTALYHLYYAPRGAVQRYVQRDPVRRAIDERSQRQMEQAAVHLPPRPDNGGETPLDLHFLSGKLFWYQTCFCAYSMAHHSGINLRPIIYDDGTLELLHQREIQRIFPDARIISVEEIQTTLDRQLPEHRFPYLRSRRLTYPNLRKLTDIHTQSGGWKLVLDSDMLFFKTPSRLIDWLRSPQSPCYMVDVASAYGYSDALMATLAGASIPERVNVGICGLNSETLDWEELEFWCKRLIEQEGTHYYQEQAMIAMLMARQSCCVMPEMEYRVMPDRQEVLLPQAVLHHYVAHSKPWYFRYAWRKVLADY